MSTLDALDRILAMVTPDSLQAMVLAQAKAQPAGQRTHVNLWSVMDALTEDCDLGSGARGWAAQLKLKRALVDMLATMPDLAFVEGDA